MFNSLFKNKKQEDKAIDNIKEDKNVFLSPLTGELLELKDVPDKVFSQKIMGNGFAIKPEFGEIVSPVNGKILTLFHTKHAIGILGDNGREILIHFGIDTVKLKGKGLEAFVKQGDRVKAGQIILKMDLDKIQNEVTSIITPIIFTNLCENEKVLFKAGMKVQAGQKNIIKIT